MAIQSALQFVDAIADHSLHDFQAGRLFPFVLLALLALYYRTTRQDSRGDFPVLNSPKWYELKIVKQARFLFNGIDELAKARRSSKGKPFRLLTNSREIIVLPPSYADFLVTEDRLSFAKYFADVRGFHFLTSPYIC